VAGSGVQAQSTASQPVDQQQELNGLVGPGDRNERVRQIQELLAQHTDLYPEGLVTGYYGDLTAQAVSRLQAEADLPQVGRVGQETFEYLLSISSGSDNDGGGDSSTGSDDRSKTLSDTVEGYEYTVSLQYVGNDNWQYQVSGSAPNSGYELSVSTDGNSIMANVEQTQDVALQVITDLTESGNIEAGPNATFEFSIRGDIGTGNQPGPGGDQQPTAELSVTPSTNVDSGQQFRVDASGSSDPNGDTLEYRWSVDTPRGGGGSDYSDRSGIQTSFDTPGTASFSVTVRDSDGNTDSESVEVVVGEADNPSRNQPPTARLSLQRVTHTLSNDYQVRSQNYDTLINILNDLRGVSVVEPEYDRGEIGLNVSRNPSGLFQTIAQEVRGEVREPGDSIGELARVGNNEVEVGAQFTVDASNSSDPDASDDDLEYQWEVEAPSGQTGGGSYQDDPVKSGSFNSSGTAKFEVTVRDEDGGTDTETLEFQVGEADGPGDSPSGRYDDQVILERTVGGIQEFPVTTGDVNQDGEINPDDARLVANYINNQVELSNQQQAAADVNGSGQINGRDVNKITEEVNDPTSSPRFPVLIGDVDGNGSITAGDAGLVQDYVRGEADLSDQQLAAADVNGDGEVTADVDDTGRQNQPPQAEDDSYSITPGEPVQVSEAEGLLANDSDPNGDSLEVTNINQQSNYRGVSLDPTQSGAFELSVETAYESDEALFRYTVSDGELEDSASIEIDVRDAGNQPGPGGDQQPTAELSVTPSTNVDSGQQFRVDASGSSDPNGDTLEYRWSVDTPRGGGGSDYSDRSGIQTSFDTPGTASFSVTVRDSDGNTDSESVEVVVGGDEGGDISDAQLILDRTVGEIEEFPADDILIGDVDQNGSITAGDAGLIQDYIQGDAELNFRQKAAADVDGDGEITADDMRGGGEPVDPPIEQPVLPAPEPEPAPPADPPLEQPVVPAPEPEPAPSQPGEVLVR
jgi:hypothetical protein